MTNYEKYSLSLAPGAWEFGRHLEKNQLLIKDKDLVKFVLQKDGMLLKFCCRDFRDDIELVKIAVTKDGMALDYASERLKDNEDVVKIAMKFNQAIMYASQNIKHNKNFALTSLIYNPSDIIFYSNEIQNICGQDKKLMYAKLKKSIEIDNLARRLELNLTQKDCVKKVKI